MDTNKSEIMDLFITKHSAGYNMVLRNGQTVVSSAMVYTKEEVKNNVADLRDFYEGLGKTLKVRASL